MSEPKHIFAADGGPYGPEDFDENPFEFIGPLPCPGRCCQCEGFHCWIEECNGETVEVDGVPPGFVGFVCKHCSALSDQCDRCDGPMGRVGEGPCDVCCDDCLDDMHDVDDAIEEPA